MAATLLDVEAVRARFSSLHDDGFVFLDAPGGSQVPDEVGDAIARALRAASDWKEGDRILVSRLDHDGGVAPWVELAADRGFEIEWVDVTEDLRFDYDDLANRLDERVHVDARLGS